MNIRQLKSGAVILSTVAIMAWSFTQVDHGNRTTNPLPTVPVVHANQTTALTQKLKTSPSQIYVDGKLLQLQQTPLLSEGSTLVPLRGVLDEMGMEVKWLSGNKQVQIKNQSMTLKMTPGEKTAIVNGKDISLSAKSIMHGGTTYVPLRFISETFGKIVGYDKASKTISISTKPYEQMKVIGVTDGDTITAVPVSKLSAAGKYKNEDRIRIRFIGVDTPESTKEAGVEPGGLEASAYTKERLLNQNVFVTLDTSNDPYGRTLAYIHLQNGEFFNATLLSEGYGKVMNIAPNTLWSQYFNDLQAAAQASEKNLWNPAMYQYLSTEVSSQLLQDAKEAGLSLTQSALGSKISSNDASSLLLYMLYPEARTLMSGYKLYQVATDDNTKDIITQLYQSTQSKNGTIATGEQLRSLILVAIGIKEDSMIVDTLDNLGLLPSPDRELTVAEMITIVEKLQAFLPTLQELKDKAAVIETGIEKLVEGADQSKVEELVIAIGDKVSGVGESLKNTTHWIKEKVTSWFKEELGEKEINAIVEETKQAAADLQKQIEEGAYGVFD